MKLPTLRIAGTLALATAVLNGASAGALERQLQAPSGIVCTTAVEPVCARDKTGTLSEAFAASRLSMMRIMARRMNAATVVA